MKIKNSFLICLAACFLLLIPLKSFAEGEKDSLWRKNSYERKVNNVGQRIIRANEINEMITFRVPATTTKKSQVNAFARDDFAVITIERPLLRIIDNDDELAAVLSHEIIHVTNRHGVKSQVKRGVIGTIILAPCITADIAMAAFGVTYPFFTNAGGFLSGGLKNKSEQKYELEADNLAVDLMVKAGYNPLYMESIYKKVMSDGSYVNFFRSHPKGSIRVANIHQKIAADYPEFLEQKIEQVENKDQKSIIPVNNKENSQSPHDSK